jgi:outer membrane protein assembly factor BamD
LRRKKYENPISKSTEQPDKVLFDKAINDIERSRYEVARLTLNTLINTYDTSEYLAKAKLAIADSWYREGGAHGLAQAEAEYKDFILFYPTMEEAAEAQEKVCSIHFKQMEKADRDKTHAVRAEDECRQLLVQFPNSKFAPQAQQMLREIQEVLADGDFRTGHFYHHKGSYPAAANRLSAMVDQYPLYSAADEALWELGDSYSHMGDRFEDQAGAAYARIVKDYPLSAHVDDAKDKLQALNKPIPETDPTAYARMKYEIENRQRAGMISHAMGIFRKSPDVRAAAKSGTPAMTINRPTVPVSVPSVTATGVAGGGGEVVAAPITGPSALDTNPDARQNPPKPEATKPAGAVPPAAATGSTANTTTGAVVAADQPLPANHQQPAKPKKKKNKKKDQPSPDSSPTDSSKAK